MLLQGRVDGNMEVTQAEAGDPTTYGAAGCRLFSSIFFFFSFLVLFRA